jgi:hypothetical protein
MTAKDFDDGMDEWETGVWPVAYANCEGTEDMPTGVLNTVLGYPSGWDGTLLAPTQLAPTAAAQQYRQYRPMRYQPPRRGDSSRNTAAWIQLWCGLLFHPGIGRWYLAVAHSEWRQVGIGLLQLLLSYATCGVAGPVIGVADFIHLRSAP